ncbi:hypothetical protein O97_01163 [Bartonella henselae str. Zeus]|nr:hypothetical protein Q653_00381 [Bartonella henselae JK 42]ETS15462.1 hypothetical protein Q652_00514 [Bartonella henselae JK 41]KEC57345.1 hypothetical protein O97_01163 [Bartonella henselae str. Zeus]KEC59546.1 hypothetical protein O95_01251 [Bartonella henselae JK 53]OLL53659.1 hypothetical protein AT238_06770 [Bartonella henselae]
MIASLSGWSYSVMNELDPCDFLNIKEILEPLITKAFEVTNKFQGCPCPKKLFYKNSISRIFQRTHNQDQ